MTWNYLLTWKYFNLKRSFNFPKRRKSNYYSKGGIYIYRKNNKEIYIALNKGGSLKYFKNKNFIVSDTGISIILKNDKVLVSNVIDKYKTVIKDDFIRISGKMGYAKYVQNTVLKTIILRILMITFGRFSKLIRIILQNILIVGKKNSYFQFDRTIKLNLKGLSIVDKIYSNRWDSVKNIQILPNQTSIYNVMSNVYHETQLSSPIIIDPNKVRNNILKISRTV